MIASSHPNLIVDSILRLNTSKIDLVLSAIEKVLAGEVCRR
jgi:hypothetical protein